MSERIVENMPNLASRLERRYPGTRVTCEHRVEEDGSRGITIGFHAEDAELLISHGLARRRKKHPAELEVATTEFEARGCGEDSGKYSYVYWHSYDGAPPKRARGLAWPPKWTQHEFQRIWRRMVRSAPAQAAQS